MLVTGGNSGLGYWTAYWVAKKNGTAVITCRNQKKCNEAAQRLHAATGNEVMTGLMDLSSFASIRAFSTSFYKQHKALHSLVLNAGVMHPPFSLTKDGLESQIGTNHFGHFLIAQLLVPLLEKTAPSTIVVVSSSAHYRSYPEGIRSTIAEMNNASTYNTIKAYGQSKLANILFAQELAVRVKEKGILVNSIHPGAVATELMKHNIERLKGIPVMGTMIAGVVEPAMEWTVWNPKDAAFTQLYAAVSTEIREKTVSGRYFHPIARENKPHYHAANQTLQRHLWEITAEYISKH